ncbi:MAG: transcriptional repressor [Nitrospiraceae bacterium]|nr:transcriptional repressor [Nitrospiraceae bacterium]
MKENKYKDFGFKLTPQRLAILGFLEGNTSHPSAEEIDSALSEKFPTMSLATVYNTLETLRQRGLVRELSIDPDKKRFDPNVSPHNHLICMECRRVVDVQENFPLSLGLQDKAGFDIIGHHVEFYGICPECRRAAAHTT